MDNLIIPGTVSDWSFSVKTTSLRVGSVEREQVGCYDPRRPQGQRWRLLSVNGRRATEDEVWGFLRSRLKRQPTGLCLKSARDQDEVNVLEETQDWTVVRLRYEKNRLPEDLRYISNFLGKAYIDKHEGFLSRIEFVSEKSFSLVGDVVVTRMKIAEQYFMHASRRTALLREQSVKIDGEVLSSPSDIEEREEFYKYRFVGAGGTCGD